MGDLYALTLHRPWAWAICHAGKGVENRDWRPPSWLVGKWLAIHAGKTLDPLAVSWIRNSFGVEVPDNGGPVGIVAVIKLARFVKSAADLPEDQRPWFVGEFGWVLENAVVFPEPVFCKGAQKLWTVSPDVLRRVRIQFDAARKAVAA